MAISATARRARRFGSRDASGGGKAWRASASVSASPGARRAPGFGPVAPAGALFATPVRMALALTAGLGLAAGFGTGLASTAQASPAGATSTHGNDGHRLDGHRAENRDRSHHGVRTHPVPLHRGPRGRIEVHGGLRQDLATAAGGEGQPHQGPQGREGALADQGEQRALAGRVPQRRALPLRG